METVTLLSITGQVIIKKEYRQIQEAVIRLPLQTHLSQGIYFLQVKATDGTAQTIKLVKE